MGKKKQPTLFLLVNSTVTPKAAKDLEQEIGRSSCSLAMHISTPFVSYNPD